MRAARRTYLVVALLASPAFAGSAGAVTLREFPLTGGSFPIEAVTGPFVGPNGDLWFGRGDVDSLGQAQLSIFDPDSGQFAHAALTRQVSKFVLAGGAIWGAGPHRRTGEDEPLLRIDATTRAAETVHLVGWGGVAGLAAALDGSTLYAVLEGRNPFEVWYLVAIDPGSRAVQVIRELARVPGSEYSGLTVAHDGALWTTRLTARPGVSPVTTLLEINPATGQLQEYPVDPHPVKAPAVGFVLPGADGDLWFTLRRRPEIRGYDDRGLPIGHTTASDSLAHMTPDGRIEEIDLLTPATEHRVVSALRLTRDGAVWYATPGRSKGELSYLVRIDPQTGRHEPIEPLGEPVGLAIEPDLHTLWYINFVGSGRGSPRSLVRVDIDSTAPNTITTANATRRGLATFVNCARACRGTAEVVLRDTRRGGGAAASRARRRATIIGKRRFRGKRGATLVRVPVTGRGRALLRRSRVARVTLRTSFRDRRHHTTKREFRVR